MAGYYLSNGSAAVGPFDLDAISRMRLSPHTAVRDGDAGAWVVAASDPRLGALFVAEDAPPADGPGGGHWGPVKDDGYVAPGLRKYSAVLEGLPFGVNWEQACRALPNTIAGHYFAHPTRCVNTGVAMWGEWHVPDAAFADAFNALVFLKPEIPLNLGHIGWGFALSNGQWCWGATEIADQVVIPPGKPNGVFIEVGTREQMLTCFRDGVRKDGAGQAWKYQSYKPLRANYPDATKGRAAAELTRTLGYVLVGSNCMTHATHVLCSYAGWPIVPPPWHPVAQIPNVWFATIGAREYPTTHNFWNA